MRIHLYKRLVAYLKPYWQRILLAIGCSVIVGAISTSPVPIVQKAFDDVLVNKDFVMAKVIPLLIIGLYLIKGALTYLQNLIIYRTSWVLVVSLRSAMFEHIHKLPMGYFEESTTGHLISRINNDVQVMQSSVTNLVKEFLQNFIMLIGLIIWLFYLKWDWAWMAMIIFPLAAFPIGTIARKLRKLGHQGQEILADILSTLQESFSGIKIIRAFGLESQQSDKFQKENEQFLRVKKKDVKYVEMASPFMESLGAVCGGMILWYGGTQVLTGQVSQGTFIAFIVALFMMYAPVRLLFKLYAKFQTSLASAERVFSVLDQERESLQGGDMPFESFEDRIEYKGVSFKYPTRNALVLDHVDLVVQKSEVLAIVGMSGAGKTTLVDLLFRFFKVTDGQILIDGVDINDFEIHSLRQHIALVTQETFLFNDTIWNNIHFGNPEADEEEVHSAARAAHVESFVSTLDDGYQTLIGERGVKLSGGQRQRIAIARALLRNAPILVLDEATSSLDSESEKLVQDALYHLMEHRTTFVIAHRLSTIKHADRIIVLDQGQIVESGNHEELLQRSGIYQKYYEMQLIDIKSRE